MLNHYPERQLNLSPDFNNRGTSAIWSRHRKSRGKAVIFIHGYGGNVLETWSEFHKLLPQTPEAAEYDLIFYGYDGLYSTIDSSAALFCRFLNQLFTQPLTVVNPSLSSVSWRSDGFQYERIVLAAHSLGAVICRRTLLFAIRHHHPWINKTSLVLYAPAHMGANVKKLVKEAAVGYLRPFVAGIFFVSPLINELAEGSKYLRTLLRETEQAIKKGQTGLIAKSVAIAERERIVVNQDFAQDPPPVTFAGTTHRLVCKPNANFLDPIDLLRGAL
jgi:pimeloyl-ACP methyl ester carboxylesterase